MSESRHPLLNPAGWRVISWTAPLVAGIPLGFWLLPQPAETYHWVGWTWLMVVLSTLIGGNQWLHRRLNVRIPWIDSPQRRFFVQLLISLSVSLLILNLSFYLFHRLALRTSPEADQYYVMNVYGLIFVLPLISAQTVSYLFALWKRSTLLSEKLEQENIQTRLESLRSHLDPHFLFNSLNILSSLIDKSSDDAQEFLASFSDVYRYVLQHKHESLVPLRTEWNFLESYLHLIQVRFRDQIHISLSPPTNMSQWSVPPLATQMLVENAIKHNKASEKHPLTLEVLAEDEYLVVRNTLRPHDKPQQSHGSGLNNLRSRYQYLSTRQLDIHQDETHFAVRIPLIKSIDT